MTDPFYRDRLKIELFRQVRVSLNPFAIARDVVRCGVLSPGEMRECLLAAATLNEQSSLEIAEEAPQLADICHDNARLCRVTAGCLPCELPTTDRVADLERGAAAIEPAGPGDRESGQ